MNSGPAVVVACAECQSRQVRPSRSSYPLDRERVRDGAASFWRCSHCGARFIGPLVLEQKRRHHRSHSRDPFDHRLRISRLAKRWVFPLVVVLVTIMAVAFILERRNRESADQISEPDR